MKCSRCNAHTVIKRIHSLEGDKWVDECSNSKCRRVALNVTNISRVENKTSGV